MAAFYYGSWCAGRPIPVAIARPTNSHKTSNT